MSFELTGVLLAAIAIGALEFARRQVKEARDTTRAQIRAMRASAILGLDERWESPPLQESREKLLEIYYEARAGVAAGAGTIPQLCGQKIARLREEAPAEYRIAFRICGFFETAGYAVRAGYLEGDDVVELFGAALLRAGDVFGEHIEWLQRDAGDQKLYEYFVGLVARARERTR